MGHAERVYVVLGGGGAIGRALATAVVAEGARVVLAGRRPEPLAAAASALGPAAVACPTDARVAADVDAALEAARDRWGRLDGVACCVGSILLKPAHLTSLDEWDDVLATNLRTAFVAVRAAAPRLDRGGSIVLVSSAAATVGLANHEAIAAAKAGVDGLTRAAAATYAGRGVRVNAVAPGLVDTPLAARITSVAASRQASEAMHPLGRLGTADDVAAAIGFLLSERAAWITGEVLAVDGGLASVRRR